MCVCVCVTGRPTDLPSISLRFQSAPHSLSHRSSNRETTGKLGPALLSLCRSQNRKLLPEAESLLYPTKTGDLGRDPDVMKVSRSDNPSLQFNLEKERRSLQEPMFCFATVSRQAVVSSSFSSVRRQLALAKHIQGGSNC